MDPDSWPRVLTESRFKTGLECPTKLFYAGKPNYINSRGGDEFLNALSEGHFQVVELAKLMHSGGVDLNGNWHTAAGGQTASLLLRDEVTIYGAAVRFANLSVRIDVLKKHGQHIDLIKVSAKLYDPTCSGFFRCRTGAIRSDILPDLQSIAFEKLVFDQAYPGYAVSSYLVMPDKLAVATVDQLNQRFKLSRKDGKCRVVVAPGTTQESVGANILATVPVSVYVDQVLDEPLEIVGHAAPFPAVVENLASSYERDERIAPVIGAHCAKCEFRTPKPDPRSGFHLCWAEVAGWNDADFAGGTVLDLWNFRRKDELIQRGVLKLSQVREEDIAPKPAGRGLSDSLRQWMQASGQWPGGGDFYLDREGLRIEASTWRYPLHFIDFESSRTAIPFHKGRSPYEQIAFQFSHHLMTSDGRVEHVGQFLEAAPGAFPNYALARELRRQLIGDQGSILRWASHENTVMREIWSQLDSDPDAPADKTELQCFIDSITSNADRTGERSMVDLCELARRYYFHPGTKGSSSIKKVLPAVMAGSPLLRDLYAHNSYGSAGGIRSLNFSNWAWWRAADGTGSPLDPYTLLPPVFADGDPSFRANEDSGFDALRTGTAAMLAYARLQFEALAEDERRRLEAALLKYCELDTLAMVMIWQAWHAELNRAKPGDTWSGQ